LLPGARGETYVIEVNAVPGWRALAAVSGIDVAKGVVRYLTSRDADRSMISRDAESSKRSEPRP
jgi:hypothetical protein